MMSEQARPASVPVSDGAEPAPVVGLGDCSTHPVDGVRGADVNHGYPHQVTWWHEPGWGIRNRVACLASEDAACRTLCKVAACQEEGCTEPESHERERIDYCNVVTWLESTSLEESYDGDDELPVHDGRIRVWWESDEAYWAYADDTSVIEETTP